MTEKEIVDIIKQTEKDLHIAKEFLSVWRRRNGAPSPASLEPARAAQPPLPVVHPAANGDYGANKKLLLRAVELCPNEYTIYDVEKALVELGSPLKRAVVQQGVSRLAKAKAISVKTKGSGPRPTIYTK